MPLITKQYIYETIASLLEGGDPSAGKKFERRMVEAHMQQAINRKLKTEYLTVTLPGDETIPEGLVIATYNDIPVVTYKNNLSRAQLPAMPVSLRRNMGVYFVGPATSGNSATPVVVTPTPGLIIIESAIGGALSIVGTTNIVTGVTVGSSLITCVDFVNRYVSITRGSSPIPGIDPGDGSNYFTKAYNSTSINLSSPLVMGEYIKIQTL